MSWDLVKKCTVAVTTPEGSVCGTGFFVSPEGHLITCAHVVEAAGGWEKARIKGQSVNLIYLGDRSQDDFAVLQLSKYQGSFVPISETFQPMDRFLAVGYGRPDFPEGASIDGTITDINPQTSFGNLPMLRLRVKADSQRVQGGYSGSPVFNAESQQVVGLIAAYDHTEGALALPVTTVLQKWSGSGQLLNSSPSISSVEPHSGSTRVFISYRSKDPDLSLAQQFYEGLRGAGHIPFMAGESIRLGENWPQRVDTELEQCDYFLLLLSHQSAVSEMVTEEVRRAKQLRDTRPSQKPVVLPIRVGFPMDSPLNYDLRGYLQRIQQREWKSPMDTFIILNEILSLISTEQIPPPPEPEQETLAGASILAVPDGRPSPVAEPEIPGGQMELASAFYMERPPIESECFDAITRRAALIRIKAPRQMGKTSLMARILHHAEEKGYRTLSLTFQLTDESVFSDLNQFLRRFCALISRKLRIPVKKLDEYWDEQFFGPKDNCTAFFEECLLPEVDSQLVIGLDEVDQIFPYNAVAKEFLTLLRAWNEQGKVSELWGKLRLVIVHSTEVYVVMDTNSSPFNVGLPIDLSDFTSEQVAHLAGRHGLDWGTHEIEQLMGMVGGHPYLIRMALYHIAKHSITISQLLREAPTEAGLYGDHLRRHLWNLQQHPELAAAIRQVVNSTSPVRLETVQAFKLRGMGLVHLQDNDVIPRYDLYRFYFRDRLRSSQ